MQEQETSRLPGNDLALASRRGWTRSLACHQSTPQVTMHDGTGDVFNLQGAGTVFLNAGLESSTLQTRWAWTTPSQGLMLDLHQHSEVSPGLALLHVCGILFRVKEKGPFVVIKTGFKPKGKSQHKACCLPCSSGFSKCLKLTTDFYVFVKPLILTSQPLALS